MEEEDFKPMFEGLPEVKGSPSPEDSDGSKERIMKYACLGSGTRTGTLRYDGTGHGRRLTECLLSSFICVDVTSREYNEITWRLHLVLEYVPCHSPTTLADTISGESWSYIFCLAGAAGITTHRRGKLNLLLWYIQ